MGRGKKKEQDTILVNPNDIYFAHSKIRPFFTGCGSSVEGTLQQIIDGEVNVEDLPLITVIRGGDGIFVSLNNRRLYVLKKLQEGGHLVGAVKVRTKPALARELERYTKERCSLKCSIMREQGARKVDGTATESGCEDDEDGKQEEEEEVDKKGSLPLEHRIPKNLSTATVPKIPDGVVKLWKRLQKDAGKKDGNARVLKALAPFALTPDQQRFVLEELGSFD